MLRAIAWKLLLGISLLVIVGASLWANARGHRGTYTDLMAELRCQPTAYHTISNRFESRGEGACRDCLQEFFGLPFASKRLLRNSETGHNLELDCYNEEVGLGVEYQGRQHYEFIPFFHRSPERFASQRARDEAKARMCAERGIRLIAIPYTVPVGQICPHLRALLLKAGYKPRHGNNHLLLEQAKL